VSGNYVRRKSTGPDVIGTERRPASCVPPAPKTFDGVHRAIWRELWRTPVAATWTLSDERFIAALCRLHGALEAGNEGHTYQLAGQIANLSSQLGLSPKSRSVLSIEIKDAVAKNEIGGRGAFTVQEVA